jgi:fructose/tagatose bisphosphate aldolase
VRLDLDLLARLAAEVPVPLVLHGASSIEEDDIRSAVRLGIRKINVGSRLKQTFLGAMRDAAGHSGSLNPYEAIGSGLRSDVMVAGRLAMQAEVQRLMRLFGSAGKADS